jgi:uncharacterized Zn finger protein (UPF0148 family)
MTRVQNKCYRCGWSWFPRKKDKSVICPSCKSPYWNIPRVNQQPDNTRITEVYDSIKAAVTEAIKEYLGKQNTPDVLLEMRRSIHINIAKALDMKELTQLVDNDKYCAVKPPKKS